MSLENLSLKDILLQNNVKFDENNKIILKDGAHIKIDCGLSFDAPHSQNWIDNDVNNNVIVFGFEANPNWINYITSPIKNTNFKDYHEYTVQLKYEHLYNKFFIVPVAVGNVEKPLYMDLYVPSSSEGCCSLHPSKPESRIGECINKFSVPVFNLSDFFDLIPFDKIEYIDYIKIDVQGYDINVLYGCKNYLSEKVVYVTIEPETSDYYGCENNSTQNIVDYMRSIGFQYIDHPHTCDPTFINSKFLDKGDKIYIWQKY